MPLKEPPTLTEAKEAIEAFHNDPNISAHVTLGGLLELRDLCQKLHDDMMAELP